MSAQLNPDAAEFDRDFAQGRLNAIDKATAEFRVEVERMIRAAKKIGVSKADQQSFTNSIEDAVSDLFCKLRCEFEDDIVAANRDLRGRR